MEFDPTLDKTKKVVTWYGVPIETLSRDELIEALDYAVSEMELMNKKDIELLVSLSNGRK